VPGGKSDRKTGAYTDEDAPEEFIEKLDISLNRLGLEYVDILYLHSVKSRSGALHEPLMEALLKAKRTGKTRFIGLSTHRREPEVIRAAVESKVYEVVLTAYNFKQDHHEEVGRAIEEAGEAGLGIVAMKTIPGGGYLDKERQVPLNIKAALKWVLQNKHVHTTIPGFNTFDQLQTDLEVMHDLSLSAEEHKDLEEAMSMQGLYCQGCETCLQQCPGNMPIPDLMRSYMYAYGYRNREAARELITKLEIPAGGCDTCSECAVVCRKSFSIKKKIEDIVRIKDVPQEFLV
jgi:predicted aldo/keto reductase-like oxidoreductase